MDENHNDPFFTKYAYFTINNIYKIAEVRPFKTNIWETSIIQLPPVYVKNNPIYFQKIPSVITIPIDEIDTKPLQETTTIPLLQVAPDPNRPIVVPLPPIIWSGTGEVKYIDLEDGFYGIVSDDGKCYDPVNLPPEFQKDGLQVSFKMKILQDQVTFHMWGTLVEILEINAIT
jgi:hypothetical protein